MRALVLGLVTSLALASCIGDGSEADGLEQEGDAVTTPLAEFHCTANPATGPKGQFRNFWSGVVALSASQHRGFDLVATTGDASQVIAGELKYGLTDTSLGDEWVQLYACTSGSWTYLGPVLTNAQGHFALTLSGAARLSAGIHDLFVSVFADRTKARFTAVVAPAGTPVAVTDVDGTLTSSEDAFAFSIVTGASVAAQANAAAALTTLRDRGYAIVYLTARMRSLTPQTRKWLADRGFPSGALRLASGLTSGQAAADYKLAQLEALVLEPTVAIGNRATDAQAYHNAGIASSRTFLMNTEFASEDAPAVSDGWVVPFNTYAALLPVFAGL